ncbi:MAG: hypothetical protein CMH57_05680 [Myxococcales bacterium]|nr:hypothetical protein [Myxococcales bacterium]
MTTPHARMSLVAALVSLLLYPTAPQAQDTPDPAGDALATPLSWGDDDAGFFDLGRLEGARELAVSGYLDAAFINAQGEGRAGVPSFDQATAGIFIGSPIYEDKVYASLAVEFFNQPRAFNGLGRRLIVLEQAEIELATPVEGLRVGVGGFLVPFGLEDERHASVVNPFITRPEVMSGGTIYPGTWSDLGVRVGWRVKGVGQAVVYSVNGDVANQRLALQTALGVNAAPLTDAEARQQDLHVFGFTAPADINAGKSYGARLSLDGLLEGVNLGGSAVWGRYDEDNERATWAAGGHLELVLGEALAGALGRVLPLPTLLGEYVRTAEEGSDTVAGRDRARYGVYGVALQPLIWDVELLVRYEFFDPDTETFDDEAQVIALGTRWTIYPNTFAKAEYRIRDENRPDELKNNLFALQLAVGW